MEKLVEKVVAAIIQTNDHDMETLVNGNKDWSEMAWSLLSQVNESLQGVDLTEEQRSTYSSLLDYLTATADPKELAYAYLESCDAFRDTPLFLVIVPHLAQSLKLLPEKQRSIETVCDALYNHICTCLRTAQDYHVSDGEETHAAADSRLVIVKMPPIDNLLNAVRVVVEKFVTPMAMECSYATNCQALTEIVLQIFHYPLLYLHVDSIPNDLLQSIISNFRLLQPTACKLLTDSPPTSVESAFTTNTMISNPSDHARSRTGCWLNAGLASFFCFLNKSDISCGLPQVYSHQFRLMMLLPCLHSLFIRSSDSVVGLKALTLLERFLTVIGKGELSQEVLEVPLMKHTVMFICWSMQFADLLTTRQGAARTLPLLCSRFDLKGRYLIFLTILNEEETPEILSYTYTLIKDFVHECWSLGSVDNDKYCLTLMHRVFAVPNGDEGQLIADLNKISSALNLARYLVTRDLKRISPLTRHMNSYIQAYIRPVGKCLQSELLSLNKQLKQLDEGRMEVPAMSVDVGDETMDYSVTVEREATQDAITKIHLVLHIHECLVESLDLHQ